MFRRIRRAVSLILLSISISMIAWAILPNKYQTIDQTISPADMQISYAGQVSDPLSIPARQVELVWPGSMRIGEDETITLMFEQVVADTKHSNQPAGFTDIYTRYNLMAEARYDVSGVSVSPANPTRESMPVGKPVRFTWKVNADQVGSYDGTIWLSLRYLPLDGGQASQAPVYIGKVNIHTTSLFGLNESMAYLLGGVEVVLAAVIVYDDLIGWVQLKKRKINTKNSKATKD
jgi:hypothetical protein